jgi:hypothetical protein
MKLASHLSNRLRDEELTAAIKRELERIDMKQNFVESCMETNVPDDTTWTNHSSILQATYVDAENKFWYAVSLEENTGKYCIRKMSITKDVQHARNINIKAKGLINKRVVFGTSGGWNPNVWFNDLKEILS